MKRKGNETNAGESGSSLSPADKIELTIKTLVAAIPHIGGALSVAIFDTMDRKRQKRLEKFVGELSNTLAEFADKIDASYFETDEFEGVFRRTMQKIQTEPDEYKQFLAHNVLARNAIESDPSSYDFDSYCLEMIESLTPLHFACLFELTKTPNSSGNSRMHHVAKAGFHARSAVATDVGRTEPEVEAVLSHLASLGLCIGTDGAYMIGGIQASMKLEFRLTEAGFRVISRVQDIADRTVILQEHHTTET